MDTPKIVDDLLVDLKYQANRPPRSCFVVFSSREKHVEIVIDCVETVFQKAKARRFDVQRLDQHLKSGDSQYTELTDLLSSCCFAVVILDGFRPNVLFEYGILRGLGKPCIVLLSYGATIDVHGFFSGEKQGGLPPAPEVDMDKHFSDVKDRFYLRYDRNNPKQIRNTLQAEYKKLEKQIEDEFLHSMFPHKEVIEKELKAHLTAIVSVLGKSPGKATSSDVGIVDAAHSHIVRIATEHSVALPQRFFSVVAHAYANANDIEKAVGVIDHSLSGKVTDVQLLSEKAYILRKDGRYDRALKALDEAIRLRPKAEFLWHNKAITLDRQGHIKEAERCYKQAIRFDSGCAALHYHYGILLYEKDQDASALREFEKALYLRPEDEEFALWKARALHSVGKVKDARVIVNKILTKHPGNADAWFVLGRIENDEAKALECFKKAVRIDPKHGGALCSSAACLSNLGRYDEALPIFERMSKYCPRHQTCDTLISNICTTLGKMGRARDGLRACTKLLAMHPHHPGVLKAKACCLARMGKHAEAITLFKILLTKSPNDTDLLYNAACGFALANQVAEALQSLRRAVTIDSNYREMAQGDPDFANIRRARAFREVIQIGTHRGRVKASKNKTVIRQTSVTRCPTRSFSVRAKARR